MKDYVLSILEGYLEWEKLKQRQNYNRLPQNLKDDLRIKHDNDAKYYYEKVGLSKEKALHADTIISFWTPYSSLLKLEAGWRAYKTQKSLERLIMMIKSNRTNDYSDKIRQVNKNIEEFAKVYYTKGNYMILPKRQMNNQRYSVAEDRIDLTLYECFGKGVLAKFFIDEENLIDWINKQNINSVFKKNNLVRNNINWFVDEDKPKWISEMTKEEIYEYLGNAILLINHRNRIKDINI